MKRRLIMMNERQILKFLSLDQIDELSKLIHYYFPLVSAPRIYDLILQVDSLDNALHLLNIHKDTDKTLDSLVYDYLYYQDNKIY